MANKEKKQSSGKGLKLFAVLLLIVSLGLIGYGVYTLSTIEIVSDINEEEETVDENAVEELDIKSDDVVHLFNQLSINGISAPGVDDSVKDFYYTKTEINDDLKLYLAFMSNDKVKNYKDGENIVIPVSELEETISLMFETARTDDYKNMNLGKGLIATYDANAKSYTISSIGEIPDESKYYGEITSATKEDGNIVITVNVYYASLEQGENNAAVYKIYKDSNKKEALSEETYDALPEISKLSSENMDSYTFTYTSVDDVYKLSSFKKVTKE